MIYCLLSGVEISKKDYLDILGDIRLVYNNYKIKKGNKKDHKLNTELIKADLVFAKKRDSIGLYSNKY